MSYLISFSTESPIHESDNRIVSYITLMMFSDMHYLGIEYAGRNEVYCYRCTFYHHIALLIVFILMKYQVTSLQIKQIP